MYIDKKNTILPDLTQTGESSEALNEVFRKLQTLSHTMVFSSCFLAESHSTESQTQQHGTYCWMFLEFVCGIEDSLPSYLEKEPFLSQNI